MVSKLTQTVCDYQIACWAPFRQVTDILAKCNIARFSRGYLTYSLSNGRRLQKWKQRDSSNCLKLCNKKEAQLYLFSNCEEALNKYVWRHNLTLKSVC